MQREDFTKDAPGELIRIPRPRTTVDFAPDHRFIDAFLPHPLPPSLAYDADLASLLSNASLTLGRLDGKLSELPNPDIVIRPLQRHEALESSRIEGTIADLDEIALFQADPTAGQTNFDAVREVSNYVNALRWGITQMDHRAVSTGFIKELHHFLLGGVSTYRHERGALRSMQAIIGNPGRSVDRARFVPPPPHDVPGLLLDLERFIAAPSDIPPLIRLALTHYQFEVIHPFPDGNGRVGRMLIPILMRSCNVMRFPHVDFSAFVAPRRDDYLELLLKVSQRGEWRAWVAFVLEGLHVQGTVTLDWGRALLALRDRLIDVFRDELKMRNGELTADHIIEHASITVKQLAEINSTTATTAQRQIDALVSRTMLVEATGRKRDRVYVAPGVRADIQYNRP
jgi:Fic family protein